MQNILEAKLKFKNNQLQSVTVKVEISKGDIRTIQGTDKPSGGYMHIKPGATISNDLLQEVADYGRQID
jgi:hypothetical protein